jgi:hypothetical protein
MKGTKDYSGRDVLFCSFYFLKGTLHSTVSGHPELELCQFILYHCYSLNLKCDSARHVHNICSLPFLCKSPR